MPVAGGHAPRHIGPSITPSASLRSCAGAITGPVRRFDRAGTLSEVIELPVARPTRPAFGGPRLDRLYVTTARDSGGVGGAILAVEPGVRGLPANVFSG